MSSSAAASRSGWCSEALLRSDYDVLLLDEPDNFLDALARGRATAPVERVYCS